jgi:hypothetical protein
MGKAVTLHGSSRVVELAAYLATLRDRALGARLTSHT